MKRIMKWVLAATLISGASVFTSCDDNSTDNPVVPDHFINEALMDKTVKPGDDFYMYALGTWFIHIKRATRVTWSLTVQ
jgi:hypothetical protein